MNFYISYTKGHRNEYSTIWSWFLSVDDVITALHSTSWKFTLV